MKKWIFVFAITLIGILVLATSAFSEAAPAVPAANENMGLTNNVLPLVGTFLPVAGSVLSSSPLAGNSSTLTEDLLGNTGNVLGSLEDILGSIPMAGNTTTGQTNVTSKGRHAAYIKSVGGYTGAATCYKCHPDAGKEVMATSHYNISGPAPSTKDFIYDPNTGTYGAFEVYMDPGKTEPMYFGMANRFCGFPGGSAGLSWAYKATNYYSSNADPEDDYKDASNSCGRCHVTLGTAMPPMYEVMSGIKTPAQQKNDIDCLVCHADSSIYTAKNRTVTTNGMGMKVFTAEKALLAKAAGTVGKPETENCMSCHEHGMQGKEYKRMTVFDDASQDVHFGAGMTCLDCHKTDKHRIAKGFAATDLINNDLPNVDVSCVGCHGDVPHVNKPADATKRAKANEHSKKIACEACHLEDSADSFYNWSYQNDSDGDGLFTPQVTTQVGNTGWRWYNGTGTAMANALSSNGIYDPNGKATGITNMKKGDSVKGDRITPFRKFNALMPVDAENSLMILPFDLLDLKKNGNPVQALEKSMNKPAMKAFYSAQMKEVMTQMFAEFGQTYKWKDADHNGLNDYEYDILGIWLGTGKGIADPFGMANPAYVSNDGDEKAMWVPMPLDATLAINHSVKGSTTTVKPRDCVSCHSESNLNKVDGVLKAFDEQYNGKAHFDWKGLGYSSPIMFLP